jgi:hypothetical protein
MGIDMMLQDDFDLRALYDALDEQRRQRNMSWTSVAREVNRFQTRPHAIAVSTITGLRQKPVGEGDGVLQMLLWLGRTPESFVPGITDAHSERYRLPDLTTDQVLRWDTRALFLALNSQRAERRMTWAGVARELRGFTPGMLTNLSKGGRVGFPPVMRLVRWLDRPAASFTRIADQ